MLTILLLSALYTSTSTSLPPGDMAVFPPSVILPKLSISYSSRSNTFASLVCSSLQPAWGTKCNSIPLANRTDETGGLA